MGNQPGKSKKIIKEVIESVRLSVDNSQYQLIIEQ
jgi:hypothetical protein